MVREKKKKGEKGRMGEKEGERERERGSVFLFISRTNPSGPDVVGHNVGIGH